MRHFLFVLLLGLVLGAAGLWANWMLATPSHDREWRADYDRTVTVTGTGGVHEIGNVRDWSYALDGEVTDATWINARIDPETLKAAYFLKEPFGDSDAIAHTMLSFVFEDGSAYVVSVEARREVGETYEPLKAAILPIFEYVFVWTTERDMFANTIFAAGDELYVYPMVIPLDQQRAVLTAMIDATADIEKKPRFYNTLFSNCTNVLARSVNRISPGAVPWHVSWHLTGYSDAFLFEEGILGGGATFEKAQAAAEYTQQVRAVYPSADPAAFSTAVRVSAGATSGEP